MSKSDSKSIKATLAAATCSLLGTTLTGTVEAQEEPGWDFNTALLYYGENDDRVKDYSLSVLARRTYVDDRFLTAGITIDSLTGATPSGALRQDIAQTFTRPSGNDTYGVPAGELPLDDTFLDTRVALTLNWQQPFGRLGTVNVGLSGSKEYDYLHLGANAKFSWDLNNRNTTLSAGFAFAQDSIEPEGGAPVPFSPMLDVGDVSNRRGDQEKDIIDAVFGVTQVINRNLVAQLNYSYSSSDGYLTDPFKVLSLVDATTGDAIPRAPTGAGPSHEFRFENRPDERTKHSVYAQAKYFMGGKVFDASYRFMTDDWEIDSHTLDLRYRWPISDRSYIEPHVRYYTQSEAEFWQLSLVNGAALPAYASADYRLGDFDAITFGAKYGWETASGNEWSVRLEYYKQSGDVPAGQEFGNQIGRDNFPDLDAVIFQVSYRFDR